MIRLLARFRLLRLRIVTGFYWRLTHHRCVRCGRPAATIAWVPGQYAVYSSLCVQHRRERDARLAALGYTE